MTKIHKNQIALVKFHQLTWIAHVKIMRTPLELTLEIHLFIAHIDIPKKVLDTKRVGDTNQGAIEENIKRGITVVAVVNIVPEAINQEKRGLTNIIQEKNLGDIKIIKVIFFYVVLCIVQFS